MDENEKRKKNGRNANAQIYTISVVVGWIGSRASKILCVNSRLRVETLEYSEKKNLSLRLIFYGDEIFQCDLVFLLCLLLHF